MTLEQLYEYKMPSAVLGLDLAHDGAQLYAACLDGGVYEVGTESGETRCLGRHASFASSVHGVPGREWVISGGYDGILRWWHSGSGEALRQVEAHRFWSWQTAVTPDGRWVASVGGQYQAGGYDYEPGPEEEPTVKVFDVKTGVLGWAWNQEPPVQAVAFSPDSRYLAAGNLMGRIWVWDMQTGELIWEHRTENFTGWGIIKGHYYTGGIYALHFGPDGRHLLVCGMGSTTDPAAGNGKQLWERYDWRAGEKVDAARDEDIGKGLMETLAWHPDGAHFVMAGRLFNGKWNTAVFEAENGGLVHSLDTKMRTTQARFNAAGNRLVLAGTNDQGKKNKEGEYPQSGRIRVHRFESA